MDTNKSRKKRTNPYLGGALSDLETSEFLNKINRPGERNCLFCGKNFISKGAHNRKCKKCKQKAQLNENNSINKEPYVYRTSRVYRGEIG